MSEKAHIAALAVTLHIPASRSLKEKRRVIKSLKDRIRANFNVSVSEIGGLDKWQTGVLGAAMISNDKALIAGTMEKIVTLISSASDALITAHQVEYL
jgi:hypothetical protein